jgi:GH25 family lysozyme M1 (1,4-beta-N-acetylmuramidase)
MLIGSDVSHFRPVTDYKVYADSGRSFLLFKATDFKNNWWFIDPTFADNLHLSRFAGLVPGVYLFLRAGVNPKAQADFFCRAIGDHRGVILAVDFEHAEGSDPTIAELTTCVERIYENFGRWPWVYTNRGYWNSIGNPDRPGLCPLWHAEWAGTYGPMYGQWRAPICWQNTDQAIVPGIELPCDSNYFLGNSIDLQAQAWGPALDCGREMANAQERGWGKPDTIHEARATALRTVTVTGVKFLVHKRVAPLFQAFLTEVTDRGYPINKVADDWSYAYRPIRGYTFEQARTDPDKWSNHAWGLAVDINATKNPMSQTLITDMPSWIDELAAKYGMRWGGNYSGRKDAMHFEFMERPEDADRRVKELDDMYDTAAETRLKNYISDIMRQGVRYTDHGDPEQVGAGNHLANVRSDIAQVRQTAGNAEVAAKDAKAAVGQLLAEMTQLKAVVQALATSQGADPSALAGAVWDEFAARAPRLEGD